MHDFWSLCPPAEPKMHVNIPSSLDLFWSLRALVTIFHFNCQMLPMITGAELIVWPVFTYVYNVTTTINHTATYIKAV